MAGRPRRRLRRSVDTVARCSSLYAARADARRRRRRHRAARAHRAAARHGRAVHARPAPPVAAAVERRHARAAGRPRRARTPPRSESSCSCCSPAATRWRLRRRWYGHALHHRLLGAAARRVERPRSGWTPPSRCRSWRRWPPPSRVALFARPHPGALPARLAGLPHDPAGARAGGAGRRLLPDDVPSRLAGEVAPHRDALRADRAQPAGHRPGAAAGEPGADRSDSRASPISSPPGRRARPSTPAPTAPSRSGRRPRSRAIPSLRRSRSTAATERLRQPLRLQPARRPQRARRARTSARATGTWPKRCRPSSPRSAASCTPAVPSASAARPTSSWARSSSTRCSTTRTCRSLVADAVRRRCCRPPIRCAPPASPARTSSTRSTAGAARRSTRHAAPHGRSTTRCSRRSSSRATRSGRGCGAAREPFDVYLLNDRGGIYALGFPSVTASATSSTSPS